jgi:hypothetical protein
MNIDAIISRLSTYIEGEIPNDALSSAKGNWSELLPHITQVMNKFIKDEASLTEDEYNFLLFGIFLLAEQKEHSHFELLLQLCDRDDSYDSAINTLFGDVLTELVASFIYILADQRQAELIAFILSDKAGFYVKSAVLSAIFAQYDANEMEKQSLLDLIDTWLPHFKQENNATMLAAIAGLCIDHQISEYQKEFQTLFEKNQLDLDYIDENEINNWGPWTDTSASFASGFIQSSFDTAAELSTWAGYQKETAPKLIDPTENADQAKMGRNEPCSCGSGKKYKKCCMV